MRKLIATFLIYTLNAYAVPPVSVDSEQSAVGNYVQNTKLPNEQATQLTQRNTRIETGNSNILKNPSYEHMTLGFGWTISNSTYSLNTTNQVDGKKALNLTPTGAMLVTQDSTINAANISGLQGVASIKIKATGTTGLKVCPRNAGAAVTNLCVNVTADNTWKHVSIPFILGITSNGIGIATTATGGTVIVDDAFVGTSAPFQDASGAKLVGTDVITGCSGAWGYNTTSYVSGSAVTGCVHTVTGSASSNSTQLPTIKFASLPAGDYRIEYEGTLGGSGSATSQYFQFTDGTNTVKETSVARQISVGEYNLPGISQSISYSTAQSNVTIELKAKVSAGTAYAYGTTAQPGTIKVYYFPPASKIYSQASQDYAYTNAGTITIGAVTTAPTKGTIVTDRIMASRKGQNLLAKYQFDMSAGGVAGSGDYLFTLPSGLSFDTNIVIPSTAATDGRDRAFQKALVGYGHIGDGTNRGTCSLFAYDATRFRAICAVAFGAYVILGSSYYGLDGVRGFEFELNTPISGWSDYGVIVGSFAGIEKCANDYECTDTFSATIDASGNISNENIDWLSGTTCALSGVGRLCSYQSFLKDGTSSLSSAMNCVATPVYDATAASVGELGITSSTTAGVNINTTVSGVGNNVTGFQLKCQKGSQDYKPKTAKVASSIGVPTVPGITTQAVDTFSVSYGTTNATTVCSASPCSYLDQIGNAATSITRSGVGAYSLNTVKTYAKLKCTSGVGQVSGGGLAIFRSDWSCSSCSAVSFLTYNTAFSIVDTYGTISCIGTY